MSTTRACAAVLLSAPMLLAGVLATPAWPRSAPRRRARRFILAESADPKVGITPTSTLQGITIDATGATVSTDCTTVSTRPRRSRQGWKIHMIGSYYVNSGGGVTSGVAQGLNGPGETLDAEGRSTMTDVVLPPQLACSSSHAGHAGMHGTP